MLGTQVNADFAYRPPIGWFIQGSRPPVFDVSQLLDLIQQPRETVHVVRDWKTGAAGLAQGGYTVPYSDSQRGKSRWELLGTLPPLFPEWLGDRSFQEVHRVRFPYITGEMANGIASAEMVIKAARSGLLGFFGAAGLPLSQVESAILTIKSALDRDGRSYGINLIHNPNQPKLEDQTVDLFLKHGVRRISASAFMQLTPAVVRYAATGLHQDTNGIIIRSNYVLAKLSRPEVAKQFLSPAPAHMLSRLVESGQLTRTEANLAALVPVSEDITVEADSGGHTDNRPLTALYPAIVALRNTIALEHNYRRPIRIGAGGGIATAAAAAAAFSLGAAYVVTGSVNQSAVESGISSAAKELLAKSNLTDVVMAPSSDMFELGVKVQVLKRGTLFSARAAQLYELYKTYDSLEEIPKARREKIEKDIFRASLEEIWEQTVQFFMERDETQIERANQDSKYKMALVFRWYLGQATRWAIHGVEDRRQDYQIWCGPAMGAFNTWVAGSPLEKAQNRNVEQIAYNILEGAAVITRAQQLRSYGLPIPVEGFEFKPTLFGRTE